MSVRTPDVERARTIGLPPAVRGVCGGLDARAAAVPRRRVSRRRDGSGRPRRGRSDPDPAAVHRHVGELGGVHRDAVVAVPARGHGQLLAATTAWRSIGAISPVYPIGVAAQLVLLPLVYWPLTELWPGTFNEDKLSENAEELVDRANGIGVPLLIVMVVVGRPSGRGARLPGTAARRARTAHRPGRRAGRGGGLLRPDPLPTCRVPGAVRRRPRVRCLRPRGRPARTGDRRPHRVQCDRTVARRGVTCCNGTVVCQDGRLRTT